MRQIYKEYLPTQRQVRESNIRTTDISGRRQRSLNATARQLTHLIKITRDIPAEHIRHQLLLADKRKSRKKYYNMRETKYVKTWTELKQNGPITSENSSPVS
jgi:hypothetical protein